MSGASEGGAGWNLVLVTVPLPGIGPIRTVWRRRNPCPRTLGRTEDLNWPTTHESVSAPTSGQAESCVVLPPKEQVCNRSEKVNHDDDEGPCPLGQVADLLGTVEIDKAEDVEREYDDENREEYCHGASFVGSQRSRRVLCPISSVEERSRRWAYVGTTQSSMRVSRL